MNPRPALSTRHDWPRRCCQEYLAHFLKDEPSPGIEYEARLAKALLPEEYLQRFLRVEPFPGMEYEARLTKALLPAAGECKLVFYKHTPSPSLSFASFPFPSLTFLFLFVSSLISPPCREVEERREYPGVGVTELRLSNGMRVAVKCTDFLDDQILISGYAYGGLSEVSEVDYYTAAMAQSIAGEAGIFGHPPAVMAELLAGKRVEVGGKLSSYMRVFSGECSPDDLETALQLVYQLFTCSIRAEAKDIARYRNRRRDYDVHLSTMCVAEIERVQREGPEEADVKTARELEQRAHEMGLQENSFWLDRVVRAYQTRLYDGNVDESFQVSLQ
ncbi:unnamed protein product [Closterium sp. NIES-54]